MLKYESESAFEADFVPESEFVFITGVYPKERDVTF